MNKRDFLLGALGFGGLWASSAVAAESYPSQTVKLVVGFAPGGATDVLARAIATQLSTKYPKGAIVENRTGAAGIIAAQAVAQARPDGHTLAFASTGAFSIAPSLNRKLPYDPVKDFTPVALVAQATYVLVASSSLSARDAKEFIAYGRALGERLSYGSFGNGSINHLLGELLKGATGLQAVHVPYAGSPAMAMATMSEEVAFSIDTLQSALPHIRAGKLRALAVVAPRRSQVAPDIPTFMEQGIDGLDLQNWFGVLAPAGTPEETVQMLARDIGVIVNDPAFQDLCSRQGADAVPGGPAEFARFLAVQQERWGNLARQSGVQLNQ